MSDVKRYDITKEESIALAERLKSEYASVEKLQKEISENETILKRPVVTSGNRHSVFRFFWPFLIYAYLVLVTAVIIGAILVNKYNTGRSFEIAFFIGLAASVALLVIGRVLAGKKRNRINEALAKEEAQHHERQNDIAERTNELRIKLKNKRSEISEYQNIVPMKYRTKQHMDRVLKLLQTGKAESFADAIDLLDK